MATQCAFWRWVLISRYDAGNFSVNGCVSEGIMATIIHKRDEKIERKKN